MPERAGVGDKDGTAEEDSGWEKETADVRVGGART